VCSNRTLLQQVGRKPWLSRIGRDGRLELLEIPPHGLNYIDHETMAREFRRRVREEVVTACRNRSRAYMLLSGGLDSRVVAAIVARAVADGEITVPVSAVTWGMGDSRDIAYAKAVAEIVGLEWRPLDLTQEHLLENVQAVASLAAALVGPVHLHRMTWFRDVEPDAVVIAVSWGDQIGRAEFHGQHLLELPKMEPVDLFGLLTPDARATGLQTFRADLRAFNARGEGRPEYVLREHEGYGQYMWGGIAPSMSIISRYCTLCQAYTHRDVYSYMWSIHPSLRTDDMYAALLRQLDPRLARLPWARTNRALRGPTVGADARLRRRFHDYYGWISGPLFDELHDRLDHVWLEQTGLFLPGAIERLGETVRRTANPAACELFAWLASFCRLGQLVTEAGKTFVPPDIKAAPPVELETPSAGRRVRRWLGRSAILSRAYARLRPLRRYLLRRRAMKLYPPEPKA
jgi:asparagine synthase (glutamine-hydrolysing)